MPGATTLQHSAAERRPIFICYRKRDGSSNALWLAEALKRTPSIRDAGTIVYCAEAAPAAGDWQAVHRPLLETAGTFVVVVTPGLVHDFGDNDWAHREIDWWLANRRSPPILIDTADDDDRWIPRQIHARWKEAQRIHLAPDLWKGDSPERQQAAEARVVEQILAGIDDSQFKVIQQDLARKNRLNLRLRRYLWLSSVLAVVAMTFAVAALLQREKAQRAASNADRQYLIGRSNELAARAEALTSAKPDISLLVAVEALSIADTPEARYALHDALGRSVQVYAYLHADAERMLFSRDGNRLYAASPAGASTLAGPDATLIHEWRLKNHGPEAGPSYEPAVLTLADPPKRSDFPAQGDYAGGLPNRAMSNEFESELDGGDAASPCHCGERPATALAVSADAAYVAAARHVVVVWDGSTHRVVRRITITGKKGRPQVVDLAFLNHDTLLTWSRTPAKGMLDRWSIRTGARVAPTLTFGSRYQRAGAFVRSGAQLALARASQPYRVELWDTTDRKRPVQTYCCGEQTIVRVIPAAGGRDFLTLSESADRSLSIELWTSGLSKPVGGFRLGSGKGGVSAAATSWGSVLATTGTPPNGAAGGVRGDAMTLWAPLFDNAFARGQYLDVYWNDRWNDGNDGDLLDESKRWLYTTVDAGANGRRLSTDLLAMNPRLDMVAFAGRDTIVVSWLSPDRVLSHPVARSARDIVAAATRGRDGEVAFVEMLREEKRDTGVARLRSVKLATEKDDVRTFSVPPTGTPLATDGSRVAIRSASGAIRIVDAAGGKAPSRALLEHTARPVVVFGHRDSLLAVADGGSIRVLDVSAPERYRLVHSIRVGDHIDALAFSPDDDVLAWATQHAVSRTRLQEPLIISTSARSGPRVSAFSFGPNGNVLAIGNARGGVEIWSVEPIRMSATVPTISDDVEGATAAIAVSDGGLVAASFTGNPSLSVNSIHVFRYDAALGQLSRYAKLADPGPTVWLAFAHNGDIVAADSYEGRSEIVRWNMNVRTWMQVACATANARMSPVELYRYFGSVSQSLRCDGSTLHGGPWPPS